MTEPVHADKNKKIKYRLEGLGCANCAAKMERLLSAEEGIGPTTINFVTKTVYLPPSALPRAQEIVESVEQGVKLVPIPSRARAPEGPNEGEDMRKQLPLIVIAGILMVLGILMAPRWHGTRLEWLEYLVFLMAYVLVGLEVLKQAARNIFKGAVFDENFLMSLATIGAIVIHELPEAVGVMLFYSIGEYIQDLAVNRSRRSIQALLDVRPEYANLIHQLDIIKVDPEDVEIGQQILVRPGEKVPLDGIVAEGSSFLDTSALTGESVPRKAEPGDTVLAGMINTTGVLTIKVTKAFAESSIAKILDLVENASTRKAKTEKFITTFSRYYTPAVVLIAAGIALIPPLFVGGSFSSWFYRALTILVISCPCALVISIPLGYFGGIGGASKHGILVKGANFLEALTNVKTVVFDKTGTLTQGVFEVAAIHPAQGFSKEGLLALAAAAEVHSNHPIAKSISNKLGWEPGDNKVESYQELSGKGVLARINGREVRVGKADFLKEAGITVPELKAENQAGTVVHVADGYRYAGYLVISDRMKAGSKETMEELNRRGIKTVMLTGDHERAAEAVAKELGIGEYYADLLPEDKVTCLEKIMLRRERPKDKIVFVGDGINDAPVLSRVDIGVAMGGLGSDAAIEAADVVLMEDQPAKLLTAFDVARYTKKIVWQNIFLAIGIKLGFIVLGMFGVANMWEAVFADVGVALLAILNAARVRTYNSPAGQISSGQALEVRGLAAK